jgi:hypothetical protein
VGDQQHGLLELLLDLQHLIAEQQAGLLVERRERFVHQHDLRRGGERARHRHALAHAAGQFRRIAPLEAVEPDQRHEMARALVALRLRQAGDLEREGDVVDHRAPGERRLLLEDHPDRRVRTLHGLAGDANRALVVLEQAADDVEQGRLAATGGADHADEFARRHAERNMIDRGQHAVERLELLDDILDDQDRLRRARRRHPGGAASRRHCHDRHGGTHSPQINPRPFDRSVYSTPLPVPVRRRSGEIVAAAVMDLVIRGSPGGRRGGTSSPRRG